MHDPFVVFLQNSVYQKRILLFCHLLYWVIKTPHKEANTPLFPTEIGEKLAHLKSNTFLDETKDSQS